eukprot:130806-Chlamydomonas_euryale.AAC.6
MGRALAGSAWAPLGEAWAARAVTAVQPAPSDRGSNDGASVSARCVPPGASASVGHSCHSSPLVWGWHAHRSAGGVDASGASRRRQRGFSSMRIPLKDDEAEGRSSIQDVLRKATPPSDGPAGLDGQRVPSAVPSTVPEVSSVSQVIFDSCWKRFEESYNLQVRAITPIRAFSGLADGVRSRASDREELQEGR